MNEDAPVKVGVPDLAIMKRDGRRIVMVTAYDAPSARLAEAAGVDMILVGDSAAMVVLGHPSTLPVTLDEMLLFTKAVARVARRPLVVGDLPFGSYQGSDELAVESAVRMVKEGGADVVKLEGIGRHLSRVRAIVDAGVPVMGHTGLTPQAVTMLGGYKAQGRTAREAHVLVETAVALEQAGCCAVVLEAMPPVVAERITRALTIPTIGIGAGPACDGQVLVWHDLLGIGADRPPRFVKRYAELDTVIRQALEAYADDVRSGAFPSFCHTYSMTDEEREKFEQGLAARRG
jgi:3-methyl-2-oxobutanoate hydroxymethyltransferase